MCAQLCGCRGLSNFQPGPTVSECLFRSWREFSVNVRRTFSVEAPKRTLPGSLLDLLEDRPRWRLVMVETAPVSVEPTKLPKNVVYKRIYRHTEKPTGLTHEHQPVVLKVESRIHRLTVKNLLTRSTFLVGDQSEQFVFWRQPIINQIHL